MKVVESAPRFVFFTGKGGVGKTSVACAAALSLARAGRRVLLVSTDPASNLDEVLGVHLGGSPTPVLVTEGLCALNLEPEALGSAYRERVVGPYRGILPEASIRSIEEQLSGACTVEIAAFDEFATLIGSGDRTREFDHVLFDTAPTGHTLRLLELPSAWTRYIEANVGGVSCLGPLAGLTAQRELYAEARRALADPVATRVVLVTRPEPAALKEAERTRREFAPLGIEHLHLVVNGVFSADDARDATAVALARRGEAALQGMPAALRGLPTSQFPLFPFALTGLENLGVLLGDAPPENVIQSSAAIRDFDGVETLVRELAAAGSGVVLTMGKGGVGKTTVARRLALGLRHSGQPVHLTTTDPAGRDGDWDDVARAGIQVSRIDPRLETQLYTREVLAAAPADAAARALIEEELSSPCTEEVAVFRAFARVVAGGQQGFVVIDTAPTGHTLLLLDAAEAYHREVLRTTGDVPDAVRELLPRLRDPNFAKVVLVTLPEATPVHEARALQADLVRAGIRPFAWVVNQSLVPLDVRDSTLVRRRAAEQAFLAEVQASADRVALVSFDVSGNGILEKEVA